MSPQVDAPPDTGSAPRRHILTVVLEDYYHVSTFRRLIDAGHWSRFERRLEVGTERTLALLDEFGIKATFFVLGWVADAAPELVRRVADRGHEIASKGYSHRGLRELGPDFREDLARAREALERASGQAILGYRAAERWLTPAELPMLDVLMIEGYLYDSSLKPSLRTWSGEPWRRVVHRHTSGAGSLWEFPLSSARVLGIDFPIAGGNHFRQFPHGLIRRAVDHWARTTTSPLVLYFHTWELDPAQPRISLATALTRVRQYRNLGRMEAILRYYFERFAFEGIASHLDTPVLSAAPAAAKALVTRDTVASATSAVATATAADPVPVTVVVPCFNEETSLPYLANTLALLDGELASRYTFHFVFVDDGSSDGTLPTLQRLFGPKLNCSVVAHDRNRGITAAIHTGMRTATSEIVCSLDCDCTYDPLLLGHMVPLLTDGVDLVTASPYHPEGAVRNVQPWRLVLSKSASRLYRLILRQKLHTYTSCFRVYRRSSVLPLEVHNTGYLGLVELVGRLDLAGGRIVEYPALLEARLLGRSKMKVARNVLRHLGQLGHLAWLRLRSARRRPAAGSAAFSGQHITLEHTRR